MRIGIALLVLCSAGCGVLAASSASSEDLPDARLGPYRKLDDQEVAFPPFVRLDFTATLEGPSLVRRDDGSFVLYSAALQDTGGVSALRWSVSDDPVAFSSNQAVIAPAGWESSGLVDPAVLVRDGTTLVYYAVASGDGIGLVRREGDSFTRPSLAPILARADGGDPIGSPSVIEVDGASWMYFTRGDAIELAISEDGVSFEEQGPVLEPGEGWEAGGVGDPAAELYTSPLGRRSIRLYYTGRSADDPPVLSIGVAASFDGVHEFRRAVANPLFAGDRDEHDPALLGVDGAALLYFAQTSGAGRIGIAAAVDPGEFRFDRL
jgi:hypothetical protein